MKTWLACALSVALTTAGCAPAAPRREVKIALVAPFEGRQRGVGYAVFPGLREAIREHAGSAVTVTFVAHNDDGDPDAAERAAHAVARDPDVMAVIGHFGADTTRRAARVYADAGLPFIAFAGSGGPSDAPAGSVAPPADVWTADEMAVNAHLRAAGSPSPPPSFAAGYRATRWALRAVDAAATSGSAPSRAAVARMLTRVDLRP